MVFLVVQSEKGEGAGGAMFEDLPQNIATGGKIQLEIILTAIEVVFFII